MASLNEWLSRLETQHPSAIDLGLERVGRVARQANLLNPKPVVITVAGTNGKGSAIKALETSLIAMGYRVCSYTSPHLVRYNERVRRNGSPVSDQELVESFEANHDGGDRTRDAPLAHPNQSLSHTPSTEVRSPEPQTEYEQRPRC